MPTKEVVADQLAQAHFTIEPGITQIFRLVDDAHEDDPDEPVKLLEVNEETLPYGIRPLYFRASAQFPLPVSIIDITPEEFDRLTSGDLKLSLPAGWRFAYPIPRAPKFQESEA